MRGKQYENLIIFAQNKYLVAKIIIECGKNIKMWLLYKLNYHKQPYRALRQASIKTHNISKQPLTF